MLKIRELREEKGLKQKELAEKIGVVAHNVGDWERGKCEPSIDILIKLAEVFSVSVDYLIGKSDDFGNVVGQSTLTKNEQRLIIAFEKLNGDFKEKVIEFAELCAGIDVVKK